LKHNQNEKVKETVFIQKPRTLNSYQYEIIGNYRLKKNRDGSVAIFGQNLNKSELTETCSNEYFSKEKEKRLTDIKNLSEKEIVKKYGKKEINLDTFCISPARIKEEKKKIPYDVPVFRLDTPILLSASGSKIHLPIEVTVDASKSAVTYSFNSKELSGDQFPIAFDPTLTLDSELNRADMANFTVPGGAGLGSSAGGTL
jgi:hypothetical protein